MTRVGLAALLLAHLASATWTWSDTAKAGRRRRKSYFCDEEKIHEKREDSVCGCFLDVDREVELA